MRFRDQRIAERAKAAAAASQDAPQGANGHTGDVEKWLRRVGAIKTAEQIKASGPIRRGQLHLDGGLKKALGLSNPIVVWDGSRLTHPASDDFILYTLPAPKPGKKAKVKV